jgi:hypothetical protein
LRREALEGAAALPSPSDYAKKSESDVNICHHRPDSRTDIPVQLYHQVFAKFLELMKSQDDIAKEKQSIIELASSLSEPSRDEGKRAEIFRSWLAANDLESYVYKTSKMESDGTHFNRHNQQRFLLVNAEVKTDYGTGYSGYLQLVAYYIKGRVKSCDIK